MSNIYRDPDKVLAAHEKEKRKKYLKPCLDQRRHFSFVVVSTDGLLGKEAEMILKKLSCVLSEKWEKSYSEVSNARMSIDCSSRSPLSTRIPCQKKAAL
jgi:hypothetical protein